MTIGSRLIVGVVIVLVVGAAIPAGAGQDNVKYEDGKLYVDGQARIFWGFIWRHDFNSFAEMERFHFNLCLANSPKELDQAADAGVYLMARHRWTAPKFVDQIVSHPAIVAWFLMDDANTQKEAEELQRRVNAVKEVDQVHPTVADITGRSVESDKKFVDIIDIYGPYFYPLPTKGFRWYFHDFLDELRYAAPYPYVWTAMQSASIRGAHGRMGFTWQDMQMYPDPGQFRLLCWGAAAHGVRGFMFFKDRGLLPPDMDNGDRAAEAVIIAHEFEIIGDEIAGGDDVRDGAQCVDPDIDVTRIDLDDHTILIASVIRDNYTYAMDDALAAVTVSLARPPQLEGELRAYSFGFPRLEPVPLREEDGQLIVGPHNVEICDTIVIEEAGACQTEHAVQIKEHLPAVAATMQSLLRYQHEKMAYVNRSLVDLEVDVPAARAAFDQAVKLKAQSAQEFAQAKFAASFVTARAAQRHYRLMLYHYREYAEQFREHAPQPMHLYLMMPHGLPKYFASFDHTAVKMGK